MSDNTNTNEEVTALEASHAEALANLTATHEEAITSLREEMATSIATAVAESTKLHKEVIAMAFDRGVSKDVAMKMLDAEDITSAKATLVDNMSMDEKPTGSSTKAKADAWADFK